MYRRNDYRRDRRPYRKEYERTNNTLPIVLAIIISAVLIIGGYICYCEYKENQTKERVEKFLDAFGDR